MKNLGKVYGLVIIILFAISLNIAFDFTVIPTALILFTGSLFLPNLTGTVNTVVSNPLIGRSKQSMGNATFASWKGIYVLKNKATSVANPRTDSQLSQRSAFTQMVAAFRQMPAVIRAGFKKLAVKKSEFNAFAQQVLDFAFDVSSPPAATLIPANVMISKGTIAATLITSAASDFSNGNIEANYPTTAAQPGQSTTDIALLAAYNITLNEWTGQVSNDLRSNGNTSMALPAGWATGNNLVVYLGFYNSLSGESSDSDNTTTTIVA